MSCIYSFYILDIEKSIEIDTEILQKGIPESTYTNYRLENTSARNVTITDMSYVEKYINVSSKEIIDKTKIRLNNNMHLIKAKVVDYQKSYKLQFLKNNLLLLAKDIKRSFEKTSDWYRLISRLMRIEYELYKKTKDMKYVNNGYEYIIKNKFNINSIFFDEIDFLSFSNYLILAYKKTLNTTLAEYALYVIYKPYISLRNEQNRWLYSKLVNARINFLINENFRLKNYEDMLYYVSLNKSRMILEDKVSNMKKGNIKGKLNYSSDEFGLPIKSVVTSKIKVTNNYIDFYIDGNYKTIAQSEIKDNYQAYGYLNDSVALKRSIKRNQNFELLEVFNPVSIFVISIFNGYIDAEKINNEKAVTIKLELDKKTKLITNNLYNSSNDSLIPVIDLIKNFIPNNEEIFISPDKWLSKYPLSFFFNCNVIRTLNFLTLSNKFENISDINFVGYFNPTGDLIEADEESFAIKQLFKNATVFKRSTASIQNLAKDIKRNVLHLSMHGFYNSNNPNFSKLLFANSHLDDRKDDKNALFVTEMDNYSQLKNNNLLWFLIILSG